MAGKDGIRNWLTTDYPGVVFEDTQVGRMKKELFDASDEEIDKILAEYEIPSPSELGKPGCYIQNTVRAQVVENRRKNDIVIVPVGCTENHGMHTVSGLDTFMVTQIAGGCSPLYGETWCTMCSGLSGSQLWLPSLSSSWDARDGHLGRRCHQKNDDAGDAGFVE